VLQSLYIQKNKFHLSCAFVEERYIKSKERKSASYFLVLPPVFIPKKTWCFLSSVFQLNLHNFLMDFHHQALTIWLFPTLTIRNKPCWFSTTRWVFSTFQKQVIKFYICHMMIWRLVGLTSWREETYQCQVFTSINYRK